MIKLFTISCIYDINRCVCPVTAEVYQPTAVAYYFRKGDFNQKAVLNKQSFSTLFAQLWLC